MCGKSATGQRKTTRAGPVLRECALREVNAVVEIERAHVRQGVLCWFARCYCVVEELWVVTTGGVSQYWTPAWRQCLP